MSRSRGLIDVDEVMANLGGEKPAPPPRPDLPAYSGRGDARRFAGSVMGTGDQSFIGDAFNAATSISPLPKWYLDLGGSALKSVEGFAGSVGQGLGDLASALSGGLIDISGSAIDNSRAYDLLGSEDPELRRQGQALLDQSKAVEDASREGFRLQMQRIRRTPYANVDTDSWSSTAGNVIGGVAPSIASLVPGLQVPVLAGYFANAYEGAYDQYADTKLQQTGDYDQGRAATVGLVSGAIETALEYLPIRWIKGSSKVARDALVDAAMSGSSQWRVQAAKQVAKLIGLGAAQEGAEEGASEFAGEILRLSYDEKLRDRYATDPVGASLDAAERIAKAAMAGAAGGALLGGAGFSTALAGSGERVGGVGGVDAVEPPAGSVPPTQQDEAIRAQAAELSREAQGSPVADPNGPDTATVQETQEPVREDQAAPAGLPRSSDLMQAAFGIRHVEVSGQDGPRRVARPEAIASLRAAGKIPATTDHRDFAHEVASDPERYGEFIETLRAQPELSRGQVEALFGPDVEKLESKPQRQAWVDSVLELADTNALGIGPNQQTPVRLTGAPETVQIEPDDDLLQYRDDFAMRMLEAHFNQYEKQADLQKRVEERIGDKIPDSDDPVLAMRLIKSKRRYEQERFHAQDGPIVPTLIDMAKNGISGSRVARLATALHAEEANIQVAKRNPDNPDVGGGMSDEMARKVIEDAVNDPQSAKLFAAAAVLQDIAEQGSALDEDHGVLSKLDRERMGRAYHSYVALKDDPNFKLHDDEVAGLENIPRNAFSVAKTQRMSRLGRTYGSLDDPDSPRSVAFYDAMFAHTIEAYERGILRRSQNDVMNRARRFAERTASVQGGMKVRYETPVVRTLDRKTNEVKYDNESIAAYKARPDVIYGKTDEDVTVDGKLYPKGSPFFIEVGDASLAETLKTVARPDPTIEHVLSVFRAATGLTRFFATSAASPSFALANVSRDVQLAYATIFADHPDQKKILRDHTRELPGSLRAITGHVLGKPVKSEAGDYYEEMRANGGTQEMYRKADFDKAQSIVKSWLEPSLTTKAKDAFARSIAAVTDATKPFEEMNRLAFYTMLRKRGWTPERAAVAARDLTLDFQVHGKGAFNTFVRAAYAFQNATLQGQRKMVKLLGTRRGKYVAGMYFLTGFFNALSAYMWFDDDENKDLKPDAAQVPSWRRDSNILIPGVEGRVPVMWGMQPARALGWWMGEEFAATMGKAKPDRKANAAAFANAVLDSFNPAGGSDAFSLEGAMNFLSPTITDPFVQLAMNKDWRGRQIRMKPMNREQEAGWVASQHHFETTPDAFVKTAQAFNAWSGGDEATAGYLDFAPETYQHLFRAVFGGSARAIEKIGAFVTAPMRGDPYEWGSLPVIDTFHQPMPDPMAIDEEYNRLFEAVATYKSRVAGYEESGNFDAIDAMESEDPHIAMAAMAVDAAERDIKADREEIAATDDPKAKRGYRESIRKRREQALAEVRRGVEGR